MRNIGRQLDGSAASLSCSILVWVLARILCRIQQGNHLALGLSCWARVGWWKFLYLKGSDETVCFWLSKNSICHQSHNTHCNIKKDREESTKMPVGLNKPNGEITVFHFLLCAQCGSWKWNVKGERPWDWDVDQILTQTGYLKPLTFLLEAATSRCSCQPWCSFWSCDGEKLCKNLLEWLWHSSWQKDYIQYIFQL